ncbi:MAG: L-histidine N(alpha)-methyltransferase [Cyanobacteria bacterium]|nr:L-histidine N(alpha)-methyltransferase [Cyanobacteriota bacterium]
MVEYRLALPGADAEVEGQDVITGLRQTPKALPPKYFYDDQGSRLFEHITALPEYYPTRTERGILLAQGSAISQRVGACDLVELGSGSASKTRILLDAYQQQGTPLHYVPVDVSGGMLEDTAHQLLRDYPALTVHGVVGTYDAALAHLPAAKFPRRMVAFIGSTLGNLPPQRCTAFMQQVAQALEPGDYFLLGVDLHKDRALLEAAYNDAQGVTAAFNLNMLAHLNWRFQGNFDLSQFRHVAFYNEGDRQIEMHIESLRDQTVTLKDLDLTVPFGAGERLLSEISRKFDLDQLGQDLQRHGLQVLHTFSDPQGWFALLLCQRP